MAEVVTPSIMNHTTHLKRKESALTSPPETEGKDTGAREGLEKERAALSKLVDYAIECARENNFGEARKALKAAKEALHREDSSHRTAPMFRSRLARHSKPPLTQT